MSGNPAARFTDLTDHSGLITGPCFPRVLIGGLAAARVSDFNVCATWPHVLNPIISGSETVRIGGFFASRVEDETVCSGKISTGQNDVLIGGPTLKFKVHQGELPGSMAGNSMVAVSESSKKIYILSFLEYSGPSATPDYAAAAKAQIESMWSGTHVVQGESYDVEVMVSTKVRSSSDPPTPGYDQIDVDTAPRRSTQPLYGDGTGKQDSGDVAPNNYTAAHEYGHSLGLEDEYHDTPHGSVPNDPSKTNNIMSQTRPDSSGSPPHTYDDHYEKILDNYGW